MGCAFQKPLTTVMEGDISKSEPQLPIYNAHKPLTAMARRANVTILNLPLHSIHLLQSLDRIEHFSGEVVPNYIYKLNVLHNDVLRLIKRVALLQTSQQYNKASRAVITT